MQNHTVFPGISLVTYSYNDHDFANRLLPYSRSFLLPLQEIVVLDDASSQPFVPLDRADTSVRVLRLEENAGSAHVKRHGLNAAAGTVLFSVDADIRPHARWLADSLPLLKAPEVGLVGATCVPARTAGYLGAALFRTTSIRKEVSERPFTSGGCWLLRRDVWERIGGLDDLPLNVFEDIFLCRKMLALGYKILVNNRFPVYETRNLDRRAYCKRTVHYFHASVAKIVDKYGVDRFFDDAESEVTAALGYFKRYEDPILIYVFLLKTALLFQTMNAKSSTGTAGNDVLAGILDAISGFPSLRSLFLEDCRALDIREFPAGRAARGALQAKLDKFLDAGALQALEEKWTSMYRQEATRVDFDRHYLDCP